MPNLSYFLSGIGHSMATLIHSSIYREDLVPSSTKFFLHYCREHLVPRALNRSYYLNL